MTKPSSITFYIEGKPLFQELGDAFGEHFLKPLVVRRHVAVSVLENKDACKSTFLHSAFGVFCLKKKPKFFARIFKNWRWSFLSQGRRTLLSMERYGGHFSTLSLDTPAPR